MVRRPVATEVDDAATVRRVAANVQASDIDGIADAMSAEMAEALPDVMSAPEFAAVVRAANHGTVSDFLASVGHGDVWIVPEIPSALVELSQTLARRGDDITVLMKLARYGTAVFWPILMEQAEDEVADPAVRMRALTTLYERFSRYMEAALEASVAVHQREREWRMRGAQARRDETIRAMLAGDEVAPSAASKALGIEISRTHTALALWDSSGRHEVLSGLETAVSDAAAALGVQRFVLTASGSRGLWAWVTTEAEPATAVLTALSLPAGVHMAFGHPARGIEGFLRSHAEALAAQRVATLSAQAAPVTSYADIEVVSLLSRDIDAMKAFVARELSGLTGKAAPERKLRATALAYLDSGCNTTAAARRLKAHKNTVYYRVQQIEEALGRTLAAGDSRLRIALIVVETLGDPVLPDGR